MFVHDMFNIDLHPVPLTTYTLPRAWPNRRGVGVIAMAIAQPTGDEAWMLLNDTVPKAVFNQLREVTLFRLFRT